jgi:DNA polymerase III subunit gamma/tau
MATQSLYRRYRPRRFSELKGQEHIVRALRDAVRSGREGQAYLFSGPRGTGKTSSARILAKVLNCEAPEDGEPCCACNSCLAVEQGTSYDVHELDAASNNGVDAIRDLVEKASLGTPGRHKVYILDEAHMLSKAASAALLKTLEEPPSHVVFVLATTDPQKISDTIRSRTQHLQFHLLPADTLNEHVRWVAADAGLELTDKAIDAVIAQGAGSARDTLSALELMAATGGEVTDHLDLAPLLQALIDSEPGVALTAVAEAIRHGYEPRSIAESLVAHLRDCFLALMAPDLVMLPRQQVDLIATVAEEIGVPTIVRAIERLGSALMEIRHAPDPRVLLEVALVHLTHPHSGEDLGAVISRVERLEQAVRGGGTASESITPARSPRAASNVNPETGRAVVGGRARANTGPTNTGPTNTGPTDVAAEPTPATSAANPDPGAATQFQPTQSQPTQPQPTQPQPTQPQPTQPEPTQPQPSEPASVPAVQPIPAGGGDPEDVWEREVRPNLKPFVRALYSAGTFTRHDVAADRSGDWHFSVPNSQHGDKCEEHRQIVEAALSAAWGAPVRVVISVGGNQRGGRDTTDQIARRSVSDLPPEEDRSSSGTTPRSPTPSMPEDHEAEIDLNDLVDAPPEAMLSPLDRLAQAFPGAELIDDPDRN